MNSIHYDQRYETLLEVYRQRCYAAAAKELSLTASAVAKQVQSVEKEISTPLFKLKNKRLTPTKECENLVKYIEKIELICRRISDDVSASRLGGQNLTVGITPTAENFALAGIMENLSDDKTQITVTSGDAAALCDEVRGGSCDLALIEGNVTTEGLNEVILDTDRLVVAVPSGSKYAKAGMITPEQLSREPLILKPQGSGTRTLFSSSLCGVGIDPDGMHVIMEAQNTDTVIKLVAGGYGLSVLSQKACAPAVESGKISAVTLMSVPMVRCIKVVYPKDRDFTEVVGKIRKYYSSHAEI